MILIMTINMSFDIVIFFAKPDESIDHFIGDESVKIFFSFYKMLEEVSTW